MRGVDIVIVLLCCALIWYILWINGCLFMSKKKALMFVCKTDKKERKITIRFKACDGSVKKILRFKEHKEYEISFQGTLTKGTCMLEILDSKKNNVLTLNLNDDSVRFAPDFSNRYKLVIRFDKAEGECCFICK